MRTEPLAIILTADLTAKARGRAFAASEFDDYMTTGCGWVPANFAIEAFGGIAVPNPFGSVGDLRLMPDPSSQVDIPVGDEGGHVRCVMADIHAMDGTPWDCDPRSFLKRAIADLHAETGLRVLSSFEHEFMVTDPNDSPVNRPFSLEAFLDAEPFGSQLVAALRDGGLEPEMWLPEFSRDQFEITLRPADALTAADRAIYLREIVRHVAGHTGRHITFSPIVESDGGTNGVHVHLSLRDSAGDPVTYDATRPGRLSTVAGSFAAGILAHAEVISAVTAPSVVSYERLAPHRWSVGGVFLGENNREALLRICPLFEPWRDKHPAQFNLEYRATDATANPHLVLGLLIRAGLDGLRLGLPSPQIVREDVSDLPDEQQRALGIGRTPASLVAALKLFNESTVMKQWFSPDFLAVFNAVKQAELDHVATLDAESRYRAYATTY